MQRHTTSNEGKVGESTAEQQGKASAAHMAENQGARATGRLGQEEALARAPRWQPVFAGSDRLAGKVALVTGGDSGIGRAVAALFAREGADVAIVYRHDSTDASNTIEMVVAEGRRGVALQGDVGDAQFCEQCVAEIVNRFGRIDILVNNAGEQHPATDIRDISSAQMEQTFRSNIFGMFHMVQAVVDHLEPGSAIINCTSVTAYKGSGHLLDYSATKGAITAFTRSLSENLVERASGSTPWRQARSGLR
jgi:NAD(P)-dependent dehydrogenase (short-subunit alcohol dehydrogenase family)